MNLFKKSLHIWIGLTSFLGFLMCWASLAQAARETQVVDTQVAAQVITSLPPMPTAVGDLAGSSANPAALQAFRINPATPTPVPLPALQVQVQPRVYQNLYTPRLRTRAS